MARTRPAVRRAGLLFAPILLLVGLLSPLPAGATTQATCASLTADGPCGMNLTAAFTRFTSGDPSVVISYIEGGINWHGGGAQGLADAIYINWHDTPVPCAAAPCTRVYSHHASDYDVNGDGVINVEDWSADPRVTDANNNGYLDAEDLIAALSDGVDHDGNGYPSDISGWDFYNNQNDPATLDAAYGHANGQMGVLHHECPKCLILPVKAGDEALDRTDDLAKAWLYAADAGSSVISSVTADLGYSKFMDDVIRYIERNGILMAEASNDFDSADHQGGMFHPYVLPGNGAVVSSDGTSWTRSNYTSWGTHNMFTAATDGGTTSESTPTVAGVFGLLLSYGRQAFAKGLISHPLTAEEAVQVMRATARRITDPNLSWPGGPGEWNLQYGYGMPNLFRAMKAVADKRIPPAARIDSPDWYSLFDPTHDTSVPVTGTVTASTSPNFTWRLQAGIGPEPGKHAWFDIGSGSGTGSFSGSLGSLNLNDIPRVYWNRAFHLTANDKTLPSVDEYTVTLRLVVTDEAGQVGEDRRSIAVHHDKSWMPGFPMKIDSGGESQPALVDLQGSGHLDIVYGDADGEVHAIDPVTHAELPGWPVHTNPTHLLRTHPGVNPRYEPVIADVAVGDLNHTGNLDVVVPSTTGRVYAFDNHGTLLPGWPQTLDTGVTPPPIPRPSMPYTRLPVMGSAAGGPVLFDLNGDQKLEVIEAGWDGYIHVWKTDGSDLAGWPVKVALPASETPPPGYVLVNDQKLDSPPAIAYLQGRQAQPFVVVRPQYSETKGSGIQVGAFGFVFAYGADGALVPGWPARLSATAEYYGSAQEFVTEGSSAPVAADVTGSGVGPDLVAVAPVLSPPYLLNGAGQNQARYQGGATNGDTPIVFTTSGAFGKVTGALTYATAETGAASLAQALLTPNGGTAINEYEVAYPAQGGSARPGYPAVRQGIDFLGEPAIADVTGDGMAEIVDGGDSNAMHSYDLTGQVPADFPKWTPGWNLFAPAVGDLMSDGTVDLVSTMREGYLFV